MELAFRKLPKKDPPPPSPGEIHVRTHRDVAPGQTNCPGRDFYRYFLDGQFKKWVKAVTVGDDPKINPGPPLPAEPPGPTEVITDTKPAGKK